MSLPISFHRAFLMWRIGDALPRVQDEQKLADTPATTVNRLALHKLSDEIF
mgnify:CR=1 FL=1